jgi:hypothetical protein
LHVQRFKVFLHRIPYGLAI